MCFQTDGVLYPDLKDNFFYAMSYSVAPLGIHDLPKMVYHLKKMSNPYDWKVTDEFGQAVAKARFSSGSQKLFFHTTDKVPEPAHVLEKIKDFLEINAEPIDCAPDPDYIIVPVNWFRKYHMVKKAPMPDFRL